MDVRIFIVSVVAEQTFLFLLVISLQWQFMVQMYVSTLLGLYMLYLIEKERR